VAHQQLRLSCTSNLALDHLSGPVDLTISASTPVKNPEPSSSMHLPHPATMNPSLRPSRFPTDPMTKRQQPATMQVETDGAATLDKSAATAAIAEAAHADPHGNGSL